MSLGAAGVLPYLLISSLSQDEGMSLGAAGVLSGTPAVVVVLDKAPK